jgi:hypothetical protein
MSLRVVINQSNYLPWKGYFDLIHDADLFIFLDDVQYTKNSWRNRNRLKGPNGPVWLTIPVGASISRRICDVPLPDSSWAQVHWRTIRSIYEASPFFGDYAPFLRNLYESPEFSTLSALNQFLIRTIAVDFFSARTRFVNSIDISTDGTSQDRVLNLLKAVGATTYISGPAGKAYLDENRFRDAGIELKWKDYSGYPEYSQAYPPFEHSVSIIDLLFCAGPDAYRYIWGWRV